jgi:ATP-dependent Lhr-like helicase
MSNLDRLAEPVRRWIWQQQWTQLRDVQEKAIPAVLAGGDVVVSAKTAAGKTEAAILPLLTRLLGREERETAGFAILWVSPLKALINDQFRRMEALCETCSIPLHRWHGDVSASAKKRARERPSGVVLITPESLEATLVRRGREAGRLFGDLDAVVVDELHAFIGSERGMQLGSILTRIEVAAGRERIDRIGLSATLGDIWLAAEALRPGGGDRVTVVEGRDPGNGVRLQIRGYEIAQSRPIPNDGMAGLKNGEAEEAKDSSTPSETEAPLVPQPIADDLFRLLRGKSNLLFAGSRDRVEVYADTLRAMCEDQGLPNEFFPHHGNLSKAEREDVETRLRDDPRPTTAVATTTLELGIDIGDVDGVAQIGPGSSVASMRQRLGRSGRRAGKPSVLRIFALEDAIGPGNSPVDRLHLDLVQSIAMVECLKKGWCEPPQVGGLHLSTLVHQILAVICQTGGIRPATAWRLLCERGPFRTVDRNLFVELLRGMAAPDVRLVEQSPEGLLMIGEEGEHITETHDFYAVFATPDEYRIVHGSRTLGTKPMDQTIAPGQTMIFAGRRWRIVDVDDRARVVTVKPAKKALPPAFGGDWAGVHDRIVETMRAILGADQTYPYLDGTAAKLLADARAAWRDLGLTTTPVLASGRGVLLFPWVGTRKLETLALALMVRDFVASADGHVIEVDDAHPQAVAEVVAEMAASPAPDPQAIVDRVSKPVRAKFDRFLSKGLMDLVTAVERLDVASMPDVAARLAISRD